MRICILSFLFAVSSISNNDTIKIPPVPKSNQFISHAQYARGATVGTIFGFGIGHEIQGRYKERGWIFTLAEGLGALSIASGVIATSLRYRDSLRTGSASIGDALPVIGFGLLRGSF